MMVCHELGHFLGGEPLIRAPKPQGIHHFRNKYPNMSAEGQADYFATYSCLPRYIHGFSTEGVAENTQWQEYCFEKDIFCLETLSAIDQTLKVYRDILISVDQDPGAIDILKFPNYRSDRTLDAAGEYPSMNCRARIMIAGFNKETSDHPCWISE